MSSSSLSLLRRGSSRTLRIQQPTTRLLSSRIRPMLRSHEPHLISPEAIKTLSYNRYFTKAKSTSSPQSKSVLKDPPVITPGFYPTAISHDGVYMGSTFLKHPPQPLPQMDGSAYLDPQGYCRKSAHANTTISGGDAARRLIRGKILWMETMRKEVHEWRKEVRKLYVLRGHGVPVQLLHHHLATALGWLTSQPDVFEMSVQNLFGALNFDRMLLRTNDGATRIAAWPSDWDNDMELYLTVMSRIANQMSNVLHQEDGQSQPRLKQWNVIVQQRHMLPPQLLPEDKLYPVIEFVPMEGCAGRVSIRLQNESVAMEFDGIFDTKQDLRGTTFVW